MSETSSYSSQCRICMEEINIEDYPDVFRPCRCNVHVHRKCLETQLSTKYQQKCEVCQKYYIFNMYHKNIISDMFVIHVPPSIEPQIESIRLLSNRRLMICTCIMIAMILLIISLFVVIYVLTSCHAL